GAQERLFQGLAALDLEFDRFGLAHALGSGGGREGRELERGDLFGRQGRNFRRADRLIKLAGQQSDRHGGGRREHVRRKALRLAAWIELSHRSPSIVSAVAWRLVTENCHIA